MKKFVKIGIVAMAAIVSVAAIGFFVWTQINSYPVVPSPDAPALPTGAARRAWRVFEPNTPTDRGFIFYPGGLVDADAYLWLGPRFAERGILTVIVPMPLNLAVLDPSEAKAVIEAYPAIKQWAIGGHSLGGAMAGQFLMRYPEMIDRVNRLILWGARLSEGMDISGRPVRVASIFGTRDGIAPPSLTDAQRLQGLPSSAQLFPIEGGNHSMFGDYGLQKGDNPLSIPLDQARKQIVDASMTAFQER